ncbi:MAG: NADH-quinone oxidoreductase subunit J family protein [Candidatus Micrarchaeaceae archaeon]
MLDLYAFYAVSAITVVSSILIFVEKRLVYAVAALATAFLGSALLFFLLGQTIMALLQLIVFVGGLSTYLIVAVSTEEKDAKLIFLPAFLAIAAITAAGLGYTLLGYIQPIGTNAASSFLGAAAIAMQGSYALFYIMATLLAAVAISGVMIINKFIKLVV